MFEEDLDVFFDDFGEKCTGEKGDFEAIFDRTFYEFEGLDDERNVATCKTREVKRYRRGDVFDKAGQTYTIKAVQRSGDITALIIY